MEELGRIGAFLERDHEEIDRIFERYQSVTGENDIPPRAVFSEFDERLQRHIDWEEDFLFPVFERRADKQVEGRPTVLMRHEHVQIRMYLRLIEEALDSDEAPRIYENALLTTLEEHNRKEENLLYPWFDRELTETESEAVLRKIKRRVNASPSVEELV